MEIAGKRLRTIRQYEIREKLGAGSGGTVYRAFDTQLTRPVVIKLLHRNAASPDTMARLMDEARMASAIEHPNVCSVYEAGEIDGQPYLVMQYVPGRTLASLIAQGPLNEHLALSIGIQIASGLVAAHRLGIVHRDLKPANIMITEDGLAKILDFGLAKRKSLDPDPIPLASNDVAGANPTSSRFGTTAYMAPEQFVTRRSTEQSDLWALGVILFEMATGNHPFWVPAADPMQVVRAIQFNPTPPPRKRRPELSPAFEDIILKALAKQPDNRYRHASELRDALKTLMKATDPDAVTVPGEASVPSPLADEDHPKSGFLSMLAERFLPGRSPVSAPKNAVAVLPFRDLGTEKSPPFYGFALADAIATRLAQVPAILIRPPRALFSTTQTQSATDPIEAGRRLTAAFVLTGSFSRAEAGVQLTWKLLSVEADAVLTGGTIDVPSLDLVTVQNRISSEVYDALHTSGDLPTTVAPTLRPAESVTDGAITGEVAEDYLAGRALLNNQATKSSPQHDLEQAWHTFESVIAKAPDFAPAHASLGIALTRYVRYGFGGVSHLIAAQRHLERALAIDPSNIEAKLYRAYTLLWRGDKEQARNDVQYLLNTAAYDAEVHIGAGVILQLDGLLEEALRTFGVALRINPTLGARVYTFRARVYLYLGRFDLAHQEIQKGLSLEPNHTLLRGTLGTWYLRNGDLDQAIATLENVMADDPNLRIAHPALASAYILTGQPDRAGALMTDETIATAAADGEMAYRVASYFAVTQNEAEAVHWLRKAIYQGNHNYPWFMANPAWDGLHDHEDVRHTLGELEQSYRQNRDRWRNVMRNS